MRCGIHFFCFAGTVSGKAAGLRKAGFFSSYAFIPVCILLITGFQGRAQDSTRRTIRKWQVSAGILLNRQRVIDEAFSALSYKGTIPGAYASVRYNRQRTFHELNVSYTYGKLSPSAEKETSLKQGYLNADYYNLRRVERSDSTRLHCWAGAAINFFYAGRNYGGFINDDYSFEYAVSLSPVFQVAYSFGKNLSGISVSDRLAVPVVSFVAQPIYGGNDVKDENRTRLLGFNSFLRFKNCLAVEKNLTVRHKLSLAYTWDYYQLIRPREIRQANHELGLMYSYIF